MSTQNRNGDEPQTIILTRRQLGQARMAALDTLHDDLGVTLDHVARGRETGGLALADARNWSRLLRDSIGVLDALGWPTDDDRGGAQSSADDR